MKELYISKHISVDFLFLFLLCAVLMYDRTGLVPYCLLASVIHECGHILVAVCTPEFCPTMHLSVFGAGLSTKEENASKGKIFLLTAAGPLMNLLCFFAFLQVYPVFSQINLAVFTYNLLPIMPLDGGRMIFLLLQCLFPVYFADRIMKIIAFLFLTGVYGFFFWLLTVGVFNISFSLLILYLSMLFAKSGQI